MSKDAILSVHALGFPWETSDPFLFCVHHEDYYPRGNAAFGPDASLSGRNLGNDFVIKDGWRMYHGRKIPGFPVHPHRGFETVTIVRRGFVDHSDSLGAAGRYGEGDLQWLTTGSGVQHSEMFPLLYEDRDNTLDLFQIWLNLPGRNKMVEPHFKMLWAEDIPSLSTPEGVEVNVYAGNLGGVAALQPTPNSWAAEEANHVAIWIIKLPPHAQWTLPAAVTGLNRKLYFFQGLEISLNGMAVQPQHAAALWSDREISMVNGNEAAQLLLLQGRPIGEPVSQYGPFVMNTQQEIYQAIADYRQTEFGGWPWPEPDPVHGGPDKGRFAKHVDGRLEAPD